MERVILMIGQERKKVGRGRVSECTYRAQGIGRDEMFLFFSSFPPPISKSIQCSFSPNTVNYCASVKTFFTSIPKSYASKERVEGETEREREGAKKGGWMGTVKGERED